MNYPFKECTHVKYFLVISNYDHGLYTVGYSYKKLSSICFYAIEKIYLCVQALAVFRRISSEYVCPPLSAAGQTSYCKKSGF